jgi:MFS family permease
MTNRTTAAEVRRTLRRYRADPRPLTARLSDLYGQALYVVVVGGILVSAAGSGLDAVATAGPPQAPDLVRWTVLTATLLVMALLCSAAIAVGPVLVSPAARTWLLSSPVDRRRLLAPRFAALLAGSAVTGGVLGGAISLPTAALGAPIRPAAAEPRWRAAGSPCWSRDWPRSRPCSRRCRTSPGPPPRPSCRSRARWSSWRPPPPGTPTGCWP